MSNVDPERVAKCLHSILASAQPTTYKQVIAEVLSAQTNVFALQAQLN